MTPYEFWNEDPALMWSYRISYIKKEKLQNNRDNQLAYLQGFYNYSAFATVVHNSFTKGEKLEYTKPIDIDMIDMTEEEKILKLKKENEAKIKAEAERLYNLLQKKESDSNGI